MYTTQLNIKPFDHKISYADKLFFIGSCFSEEVAKQFSQVKFQVLSNPFGTLYNPASIFFAVQRIIQNKKVTEEDFFLSDGVYKSFAFHSSLAGTHLHELIDKVNAVIHKSHEFLKQASWNFITLGTSYVYRHKTQKKVVANCHKLPANTFDHFLLSLDEVHSYLNDTVSILQQFNPQINIVFTVSPVRYLSYGAFENQVSKSLLFVALHKLLEKEKDCRYFPAYELFMDELRDYRYYDRDLIHPSALGVEHVWNRLVETVVDENSQQLMKQVYAVVAACKHRPMFPESTSYLQHKSNLMQKIVKLQNEYPFLDFTEENNLLQYDDNEQIK